MSSKPKSIEQCDAYEQTQDWVRHLSELLTMIWSLDESKTTKDALAAKLDLLVAAQERQGELETAILLQDEREWCAKKAENFASMLESGAGDYPKGQRFWQIARIFREKKP